MAKADYILVHLVVAHILVGLVVAHILVGLVEAHILGGLVVAHIPVAQAAPALEGLEALVGEHSLLGRPARQASRPAVRLVVNLQVDQAAPRGPYRAQKPMVLEPVQQQQKQQLVLVVQLLTQELALLV